MEDIVVESLQYYKCELEKVKKNRLDKTINECEKTIELIIKNIDDYSIDKEFESLLILVCKIEKIKDEVNKLDDVVSRLAIDLEMLLKIYD